MTDEATIQRMLSIPIHEGRHVQGTSMKITGAMPMDELEGVVVGIDDVVTMICQFKVIKVHHDTTPKGDLIRVQVMRPITMALCPMNPEDPDDDGVIRALPEVVETKVEPTCTCGTIDTAHERTCMLVKLLGMADALADGEKLTLGFTTAPAAIGVSGGE